MMHAFWVEAYKSCLIMVVASIILKSWLSETHLLLLNQTEQLLFYISLLCLSELENIYYCSMFSFFSPLYSDSRARIMLSIYIMFVWLIGEWIMNVKSSWDSSFLFPSSSWRIQRIWLVMGMTNDGGILNSFQFLVKIIDRKI